VKRASVKIGVKEWQVRSSKTTENDRITWHWIRNRMLGRHVQRRTLVVWFSI